MTANTLGAVRQVIANREECVLLVIDVQEKLIDTISDKANVLENIKALIRSAHVLDVPILVTEQERLGETVSDINVMLPSGKIRKLAFSCCKVPEFTSSLAKISRKNVIVCGIEAHICVMQTVVDLPRYGYTVAVPQDAVSSYGAVDRESALQRMRDSGAVITTTEALIYELTERAGTEQFRKVLEIVKERRLKTTK